MYGLLEAAAQIRERGFLIPARGRPVNAIRRVRVGAVELDRPLERWRDYCAMLARNRFNRLAVALPAKEALGRVEALDRISRMAAEHALDFTLELPGARGEVLAAVLARAPAIRGIQVESADESVVRAVAECGRRVTLEVTGGPQALTAVEVPLRFPIPFSHFGRPRPKPAEFFWQLDAPSFDAGDPERVRRTSQTFAATGAAGFEIEAPLAGFERQWLSYLLWGRLGYDPETSSRTWTAEFERRFGKAADDLLEAYRNAGGGARHPGAPIESHLLRAPGDARFTASPLTAVDDLLPARASARKMALEAAEELHAGALAVEQALARAAAKAGPGDAEWLAAERQLRTSAGLARFRARKHLAAYFLAHFLASEHDTGLHAARRELAGAVRAWQDLAKLDGALAAHLPMVERDLAWVDARVAIWRRFGRFDAAFHFGAGEVEPRFRRAGAATLYDDAGGFGWVGAGDRLDIQGSIRGRGAQVFRYRSGDGEFSVRLLYPDGSEEARTLRARDGALDIVLPDAEWTVGGVVIRGGAPLPVPPPPVWTPRPPRPSIAHIAPKKAPGGAPLALSIRVTPPSAASAIRLHYRPFDASALFRVLAASGPAATFTVPASDMMPEWGLVYYFEILSPDGRGWFEPDASYSVVEVVAAGQ
jgi:hypothetical protein